MANSTDGVSDPNRDKNTRTLLLKLISERQGKEVSPHAISSMKISDVRNLVQRMLDGPEPVGKEPIARKTDPEIIKLEKVILDAAAGKPLKKSISESQAKKDEQEAKTVFILLQRLLGGLNVEMTESEANE